MFSSDCKATGEHLPSFASESLQELEGLPPGKEYADLESVIKDTAAVMYVGEMLRFLPFCNPLLTRHVWQLGLKLWV
jgi:hypothetical protein